jgi:hypothetical protein
MWNAARVVWHGALGASRQVCVLAVLALVSGAFGSMAPGAQGLANAARLEGQRFDDTAVLSDRTLRLNGLGLRGVAWIKAFVAGLYLTAPTRDAGQALAMQGPKRLRLQVMLEAPSREFSKAFSRGVGKNEPEKVRAQLATRMAAFVGVIDGIGTIRKGDVIDLDFVPGQGMQLRLNNRSIGQLVEGEDFYRAILKIFIGDRPVDARMKEGLLRGGSPS